MTISSSLESTESGLKLKGDLVFATVSVLWGKSKLALEDHQGTTVQVDCSEVSRLDSAGIALLVEWKRWCDRHRKTFQIRGVQEQAAALIATYKLQGVLSIQ